jgi:hypothetical protein
MDLVWDIYKISYEYDIPQMATIISTPTSHVSVQSLHALVMKAWPLLQTVETLLSSTLTLVEDLHQLLTDAKLLNGEFSKWPANQPEEWRPRTVCYLNHRNVTFAQDFGWVPRRIDAYLDRKYTWS